MSIWEIVFLVYPFGILIGFLVMAYLAYQRVRNEAVYNIKVKWLDNGEFERCRRNSYDHMYKPNLKNWFGLRWPREKNYK